MNRRNFIQFMVAAGSATAVSDVTAVPKVDIDHEKHDKAWDDHLHTSGLTRDEYKAITSKILALHDDVFRLDWELGVQVPPDTQVYTEDVKYNGTYYWTNYRIDEEEGYNKRIVIEVVRKSITRFY